MFGQFLARAVSYFQRRKHNKVIARQEIDYESRNGIIKVITQLDSPNLNFRIVKIVHMHGIFVFRIQNIT